MKRLTFIICSSLLLFVAGCDPDDESDTTSTSGEMIAGEMTAGDNPAGEEAAGEEAAGEEVAGEMMAGEMIAGEMMAGEMSMSSISAEELSALISSPGRIIGETTATYCEQCSDSLICGGDIFDDGLSLDADVAACVISESSAEELSTMIAFGECLRVAFEELATCVSEIMACDDMAFQACFETIDATESSCTPISEEYESRIGEACFGETSERECGDGMSLPSDAICDGYADCADISDERDCDVIWECADGNGEHDSMQLCDGVEDCEDGSDELECPNAGFECADNSMSIDASSRCDGYADCNDISDERDCDVIWECSDGNGEHDSTQLCDGVDDCADGSDEADCPNAE